MQPVLVGWVVRMLDVHSIGRYESVQTHDDTEKNLTHDAAA